MKSPSSLQRGMACLNCRRKKMKCDGQHPTCTPCSKSKRPSECQYHQKKQGSRAETLQQKIAKLELRLRELESKQEPQAENQFRTTSISLSPETTEDSPRVDGPSDSSSSSNASWEISSSFPLASPSTPSAGPSSSAAIVLEASLLPGSSAPSPFLDWGFLSQIPHLSPNWWEDRDAFCDSKRMLLNIFFLHRHQCGFDVHTSRFQASLYPGSIKKPHSVLTDAMFLLGCLFSRSPHLSDLQPYFLECAVQGIRDALQLSDHILDVLQASCLLAVYFFCHGRVLEGYYHSSTAARLAMDVGLHQGTSPLSPPQDYVEYAERVAAFWQIFEVDRAWSVATGLPPALPDDEHPRTQIETAWPIPIPDISSSLPGSALCFDQNAYDLNASAVALRAKAVMLFERTARLSGRSARSEVGSPYYLSLEVSLAQLLVNIPNICEPKHQAALTPSDIEFINIHTLICAATIQLNCSLGELQPAAHDKCIIAANTVTSIIRRLRDHDYDYLDPISSTCWRCAADVYIHELTSPHVQRTQYTLDIVDQELDVLVTAMKRLSLLFPVAGIHASKTEQERQSAREVAVALLSQAASAAASENETQ